MRQEILNKLNLGEDHERECKLAIDGLPEHMVDIFFFCKYRWWNYFAWN